MDVNEEAPLAQREPTRMPQLEDLCRTIQAKIDSKDAKIAALNDIIATLYEKNRSELAGLSGECRALQAEMDSNK